MPTKAPVKKTVKTVSKPEKKAAKKVTIDDVWAGFEELRKLHQETEIALKEANLKTEKAQEEAWKAIRETQQAVKETQQGIEGGNKFRDEAWKAIRDTQKNIGGLNNTLGSLVERIMTPDLPRKFKPLGFTFNKITTVKWAAAGNIYAEIDGLLENGAQAMAVEVKTTLEIEDINDHLKRMERIRKYADEHGDKREFLGAIAAMIVKAKPKDYALKQGLFVIEPKGEDVKVTKPEGEARVW
jgi:hypothetical protein